MKFEKLLLVLVVTLIVSLMSISPVLGTAYRNVEFPSGALSFADEIVDYQLNGGAFAGDINKILGKPNNKCVSLGTKGYVIVKFTDNSLTTSGDSNFDLAVFETGTSTEELVEVFISKDGQNWIKIGNANKKTLFDIDAVDGVLKNEKYSYVKLVDVTGLNKGKYYEGADMDAVGAITSTTPVLEEAEDEKCETPVETSIPEFPTIALPMIAILGLAFIHGKKNE